MKYILTAILLITSLYAKKSDFSIVIDEPFNNALFDITEDYDRSISAVGFIKEYKKNSASTGVTYTNAFDYLASVSNKYGSKMHLIKIDDYADILLRKSMELSNFSEALSIAKTPQNGYFIGGHTLDGSLIVLKLDSNANIIFKKIFGTANYDKMSKMLLLRDGGVLAIGSSATSRDKHDNLFESGLGLSDIYLTRVSSNGDMLWSKKYGTQNDDIGVDATEADNGSIIVLCQANSEKSKTIEVMRITENGDKVWLKEFKGEKNITAHRVIKLREGSFALSLSQEDEMNKEQIRLVKIDIQKNILLDKIIHTTYSSVLNDIKEYSDSKIIGVGYVKDTFNTDGLVMLLDGRFSMLSQEHYGSKEYEGFNAVTILHNSQAAVAGVYTNKDSQESNMWIVKLNRDISMAQAPSKISSLYDELNDIFKQEVKEKKISITQDLSINLIDKNLYFDIAEYKLNSAQKEFLQKFSNKLLLFLHKHHELVNTLEISGHTSSEWGTQDFSGRYLNNAKLSMNRSFSTLSYIFSMQDEKSKKLLSNILKGSGLSFSKKIVHNEVEEKEKSRRVSFKIILKNN